MSDENSKAAEAHPVERLVMQGSDRNREVNRLHGIAMDLAEQGYFNAAFTAEKNAAMLLLDDDVQPTRSILFRSAGFLALDAGRTEDARRMAHYGLDKNPPEAIRAELMELLVKCSPA